MNIRISAAAALAAAALAACSDRDAADPADRTIRNLSGDQSAAALATPQGPGTEPAGG